MYKRTYTEPMVRRFKSKRKGQTPAGGGKIRITIRLDADLLDWFRSEVRSTGGSYQTAINLALRDYIAREPLEATLRRVVREELARAGSDSPESAYAYGPSPTALVADADDASSEYGAPAKRKRSARRGRRRRELE